MYAPPPLAASWRGRAEARGFDVAILDANKSWQQREQARAKAGRVDSYLFSLEPLGKYGY